MQRNKLGFADDDFRLTRAAPFTAAAGSLPAGAVPGPVRRPAHVASGVRSQRERLHCRFTAATHWKIIMKKTSLFIAVIVPTAWLFAGCCANRVSSPQSISFVQAMHDVGQGLAELRH